MPRLNPLIKKQVSIRCPQGVQELCLDRCDDQGGYTGGWSPRWQQRAAPPTTSHPPLPPLCTPLTTLPSAPSSRPHVVEVQSCCLSFFLSLVYAARAATCASCHPFQLFFMHSSSAQFDDIQLLASLGSDFKSWKKCLVT